MIKHNALVLEAKEPTEGYEEKEVPIPNTDDGHGNPKTMTKWIKKFRSLDGQVTELEWYDREIDGRNLLGVKVHMEDGGDKFLLDIAQNSRSFTTFCKIAENIDFTQPVEFYVQKDKNDIGASQGGVGIKHRYTKDNPGPCPPAKYNNRTKKWDFSAQETWLLDNLLDNILPAVNAQLGVEVKTSAAAAGQSSEDRWADVKDPIHDDV
jgi:hypothetical protein